MAVYPIVNTMPTAEFGVYASLLRVFVVLGILAAGLQVVMAQEAAAAITPARQQQLANTARAVGRALFLVWIVIALACGLARETIATALKVTNPAAVWVMIGLVLAQLFLPFVQGLLQGAQNFAWLGWSIILNGAGRFAGMALTVLVLKGHATGALAGALIGLCSAVFVGAWPSRRLLRAGTGPIDWRSWLRRVVPLTGGIGATLFVLNADVILVQMTFSADVAPFYSAVSILGLGLVTFTTPMASVMFPKLVRSAAQAQKSNSLTLALWGTLVLGVGGALLCTLWPVLPLRILFFNKPHFWASAQLVPWFMWSMLPVTVANVLIGNLLARARFQVVPWLVAIAVLYGLGLHSYLEGATALEPFAAFRGVILRLCLFGSLLLAAAAWFTWRGSRPATAG